MSDYPFDVPVHLRGGLPPPSTDRLRYVDARVRGRWDGVLVIDDSFRCIGVYCYRRVLHSALPFAPSDIEAFRKAALTRRIITSIPACLLELTPYATILLVSPALLMLALSGNLPPFITSGLLVVAVAASALGSGTVVAMLRYRWFCVTGLLLIMVGAGEVLAALLILLISNASNPNPR